MRNGKKMRSNQHQETNNKRTNSFDYTTSNKRPKNENANVGMHIEHREPIAPTQMNNYLPFNYYPMYPDYNMQGYTPYNPYAYQEMAFQNIATTPKKPEVSIHKIVLEFCNELYPEKMAVNLNPAFNLEACHQLWNAAEDGNLQNYKNAWSECYKKLSAENFHLLLEDTFNVAVINNHTEIMHFAMHGGMKVEIKDTLITQSGVNTIKNEDKVLIFVDVDNKTEIRKSGIDQALIIFRNNPGEPESIKIEIPKRIKGKREANTADEQFLLSIRNAYLSPQNRESLIKELTPYLRKMMEQKDGYTTGLAYDIKPISIELIRKAIFTSYTLSEEHLEIFNYLLNHDHRFTFKPETQQAFQYFFMLAAEQGYFALVRKILENRDCANLIDKETKQKALILALENENLLPCLMESITSIATDRKKNAADVEMILHALENKKHRYLETFDTVVEEKNKILSLIKDNDIHLYLKLFSTMNLRISGFDRATTAKKALVHIFCKDPIINPDFYQLSMPDAGLHFSLKTNNRHLFKYIISSYECNQKSDPDYFPNLLKMNNDCDDSIRLMAHAMRVTKLDWTASFEMEHAFQNDPKVMFNKSMARLTERINPDNYARSVKIIKLWLEEPLIINIYEYNHWMELFATLKIQEPDLSQLKDLIHLTIIKPACITLLAAYHKQRQSFEYMPPEVIHLIIKIAMLPAINDVKIRKPQVSIQNRFTNAAPIRGTYQLGMTYAPVFFQPQRNQQPQEMVRTKNNLNRNFK